jgi:hypothetical protein
MAIPDIRELTPQERLLLEQLLRHGTEESKAYIEQLPRVTVVSRCGCGCPSIYLSVDGKVVPPSAGSEILSEAKGVSPEGRPFSIILHGRKGVLSELEVYPTGSDAAFTLPDIDQIEFFGDL